MEKSYTDYYGLLFSCSFDHELNSCMFKKLRQLTARERLTYYDALTLEEKKSLINRHKECLSVREKKPFTQIAIM